MKFSGKLQLRYLLYIICIFVSAGPLAGQRLPKGAYHDNRERTYDIIHYKAELSFDFEGKEVFGKATITMRPLVEIESIALDSIGLNIKSVANSDSNADLPFEQKDGSLIIKLSTAKTPSDTIRFVIVYDCQPKAGVYFRRSPEDARLFYVHTYGEGGLHANWLPIYTGGNDKFSTEMIVTVPEPYVAISNGKLIKTKENPDGSKSWHWLQRLPHHNYIIAVYVGDFERFELAPAFGEIPVGYWVAKGRKEEGAYIFRNTTRMLEYYSKLLNYKYPWVTYDQIAMPDFPLGAMEHTGITMHRDSVLRGENTTSDFTPVLDYYIDFWATERTISHELAHHWFGDNTTFRDLSYIWINESLASYLHFVWDEELLGEDEFLFGIDLAKKLYFDYVHSEHIIRPLEYHYFDDTKSIFNLEHSYYKGAAILHSLRKHLGDEPFYRSLSHFLHKHEFSSVQSHDMKIAIEEATGQNLRWFFEQWITGAGHPQLEVSYDYLADRKSIVLTVDQVQPIVKGQGLFKLPVRITIATPEKTWQEKIWVKKQTQRFLFGCDEKPLMVSFDGEGDLVAEVKFDKEVDELAYQALNDAVPGRLWAIRQIACLYPSSQVTNQTFNKILTSEGFWGTKAEAALQLGTMHTAAAEELAAKALKAKDYRIRKAAVLALPKFNTDSAIQKLRNVIDNDPYTNVAATALVSLAKAKPGLEPAFVKKQFGRKSWYDEMTVGALLACEELGNKELLPTIKKYTSWRYNHDVVFSALKAWKACAADDPELHGNLISITVDSPDYLLKMEVIEMLGELYIAGARETLNRIVEQNADSNLVVAAKEALEKIDWFAESSNKKVEPESKKAKTKKTPKSK